MLLTFRRVQHAFSVVPTTVAVKATACPGTPRAVQTGAWGMTRSPREPHDGDEISGMARRRRVPAQAGRGRPARRAAQPRRPAVPSLAKK